jgi:hypothetical protein
MSNESTSNTRTCKDCDVELSNSYSIRCDKCYNRSDNDELTHELALAEDTLRRGNHATDEVWHSFAYSYMLRLKAERHITDGGDHRIENLWRKLWDALDGDVERDQTWEMFIDAIPGLPDYRSRTYNGTVTLKFYFTDVQIDGLSDNSWEIEEAILEAIESDLRYGYHDEMEVDYDED